MSKDRYYVNLLGAVDAGWSAWLEWSRDRAEQLGHPFVLAGTSLEGREPGKATRYSYARLDRKIRQGGVIAMDLHSVPAEYKQLVFDWQVVSLREAPIGRIFFGCDVDFCTWEQFAELAMGLRQHIRATYGFAGRAGPKEGAIFTSIGIGTHWRPNDEANRSALNRWDRAVHKTREFDRGLFRSVYPLNFLSPAHLDQPVDGMRLADAIITGKLPGELSEQDSSLALWRVGDDDIALANDALARNNLLI